MWTVADIMTKTVFTIRSTAKVQQAIALMQGKQVRSLVVEREVAGGAYGIITERDIVYKVTAAGMDPANVMVGEIMQSDCAVTSPQLSLPTVARELRDKGLQRLPVVEDGMMVGVVSISDIVMKSDVTSVDLPKDFAHSVEVALRHQRLHWNEAGQTDPETEIAQRILSELNAEEAER
ncbi:CBS domain pair protein [Synechococcus sp. PCC 7335]|uniref:CBS domain-containing protein n=1 Tax=Synechococcus sp. (strain ATCC 29403 / PCC 7335) TaxID=91464 RepID=UPI00017EC450|nr:CBS domain-containing protein [Synechococcus sp. PCC 7335]EDX83495.1 CBS domain pair protein [Synechococcus sp. PCC 7335]